MGEYSASIAFTDEDNSSSATVPVELQAHLDSVGELAGRFADSAGLPPEIRNDLILAARLHDLGKADPRFQALLHGGNPWLARVSGRLLAKSGQMPASRKAAKWARKRSGYPEGARHELLSVRMAESAQFLMEQMHDEELVLHLIGSHHGRCRPFAPVIADEETNPVAVSFDGKPLSAPPATGLERIDSGVSERFWRLVRRYGWWGLAWLETLVRLADWNRSEQEQLKAETRLADKEAKQEIAR